MPFGLLVLVLPARVVGVLGSALSGATLWVAASIAAVVLGSWALEVTTAITVIPTSLPPVIVTLIIVASVAPSTHPVSLLVLPLLVPPTPTILVVVIAGS